MEAILDLRKSNTSTSEPVPFDEDPKEFARTLGFKSEDDYAVVDISSTVGEE